MIDNYIDIWHNGLIGYVSESILGPPDSTEAFKMLERDFNLQINNHCKCPMECYRNCPCRKVYNENGYYYDINKHLLWNNILESNPVFECNSMCACKNNCSNRIVQNGPIDNLAIKQCQNDKGHGLFTSKTITKGTFICEYAGEIITKEQARKRHEINKQDSAMNYILCLNEHSSNGIMTTIVDPSQFGNIGRYINHSCNPNSAIIPVRIDSIVPRLAIFSLCDIDENSEITFDYGPNTMLCLENKKNMTKCLCNAKNCKGWLPFENY